MDEIAFADGVFATPSGRIELDSEEAAARWGVDRLPTYRESVESTRGDASGPIGYALQLLTPNTKNRIHPQFNNLRMIREVSFVDWIDEIDRWVESGEAPSQVKTHWLDERMQPDGSRLACAHPNRLRYDGTGDPREAGSFSCSGVD